MNDLLEEINDLDCTESKLRNKIHNRVAYFLELKGENVDLKKIMCLQHQVYDRPLSYMCVENGIVLCYASKGYCTYFKNLPMYDIKLILNFINQ